jgi:hypothetical protein
VDTDFAADLNSLTGGEFGLTMQGLFFANGSTTSSKSSHPLGFTLIDALSTQGIVETSNDRLSFGSGEYNWDGSSWNKSSNSSDLILNFPTEQGLNNNAAFTLSTYTDEGITIEGQTEYLPTAIDVSLRVSGNEIFSIDLSGTDFYTETLSTSNGPTQLPRQFMLDILTVPLRHTFDFVSPSKREFDFDFELSQASTQDRVLRLLIGLTFTQNFDAVSGAQGVQQVDGEIGFGPDLTIAYTVDVEGVNNLGTNPSAQQINDEFDATVRYQGGRVGTIEWGQATVEGQTTETALLVYNDGTSDPLALAFANTFGTVNSTPVGMMGTAVKSAATSIQKAVAKVFQP